MTGHLHHTLLLNAGFEPLRIVSWQRAFILFFQNKVHILEEYNTCVTTVSRTYPVPAVIKLTRWINLTQKCSVVRFSRANLYARDNYRCQYCQKVFPERELTLDHVLPVVRGGRKTWDNIVAACIRCNQKKGHRTPEEAGLKPLSRPCVPKGIPGIIGSLRLRATPPIWAQYIDSQSEGLLALP